MSGNKAQLGASTIERVLQGARITEYQRALAEVIQHQRRQGQAAPGNAYRLFAEMPHVGIERFRTGHRKHDRTEGKKGGAPVDLEELESIDRIERQQHMRITNDLPRSQHCQGQEPQQHDRPKKFADVAGAPALHEEQAKQNAKGQGNNGRFQPRRRHLQAFHS